MSGVSGPTCRRRLINGIFDVEARAVFDQQLHYGGMAMQGGVM